MARQRRASLRRTGPLLCRATSETFVERERYGQNSKFEIPEGKTQDLARTQDSKSRNHLGFLKIISNGRRRLVEWSSTGRWKGRRRTT